MSAVGRDYVSHTVLELLLMAALFIFMTNPYYFDQKNRGMLPHPPYHNKGFIFDRLSPIVLFSKIFEILQIINILTEPHETGIDPREYIPRNLVIGLRNDLRKVLRQNPLLFIIIGTMLPHLDEVVFLVSGSEFSAYWHITLN